MFFSRRRFCSGVAFVSPNSSSRALAPRTPRIMICRLVASSRRRRCAGSLGGATPSCCCEQATMKSFSHRSLVKYLEPILAIRSFTLSPVLVLTPSFDQRWIAAGEIGWPFLFGRSRPAAEKVSQSLSASSTVGIGSSDIRLNLPPKLRSTKSRLTFCQPVAENTRVGRNAGRAS